MILSPVISHGAVACPRLPPGYGWTHTELIEKTDTIVLARATKVSSTTVVFEVMKTIEGESEKQFLNRRSKMTEVVKHTSNDFNHS